MAKTIPVIISNNSILVKDRLTDDFKEFNMPAIVKEPNIPFFHQFANQIAQSQYYFKAFMKKIYPKKASKYILAIIVPDDTSKLESIFINEFFVNSDTCKAVAQMKMSLALSKEDDSYVSISMSSRNISLDYIRNGEIIVSKYYDATTYDPAKIKEDAKVLHIDLEYKDVPVYVNNFNMNMSEFLDMGSIISPKEFLEKIANADVEKL